jgi:hypothetical protein
VLICEVCDQPATDVEPLVRVYLTTGGYAPILVHPDCWRVLSVIAEE